MRNRILLLLFPRHPAFFSEKNKKSPSKGKSVFIHYSHQIISEASSPSEMD
jgi:hypothetical protein